MRPEDSPAAPWLQQGQALEAEGRFPDAIAAYDQAALAAGDARLRGIAWMNRGNALQRLAIDPRSDPAQRNDTLTAAVRSYDEAIALFGTLPFEREPVFRNHLGAAWLNRGHALLGTNDATLVADSFRQAISHLEQLPVDQDPHFRINLAGAWTNLANALLHSPGEAASAAQNALALVVPIERSHPIFAEMSLRARRVFVIALGALLQAGVTQPPAAEVLSAATDTIDDGLALARECERLGAVPLRPLAARLFRLGAQLYRVHQPHFLGEFVLENLAPDAFAADAEFRAAAHETVSLALAELPQPSRLTVGDPASQRLLETAQSLRAAQEHLATLAA